MESDALGGASGGKRSPVETQALNSTILEYYKKFGRKHDLEQYFSLNTAQGEVRDVSSVFWRKMKSQDSSDSGEKSRESLEVCRIQIKCSAAADTDPGSSQDDNTRTKSDSESPPIITEEAPQQSGASKDNDNESVKSDDDKSVKSDDNHSQKSVDAILDTSTNKVLSPSSSITSQRKLEWDSLADVGYANESDKRTSASSLSTLERLALKQQYSNNDTHENNVMGLPTAHSTPVEEFDIKTKARKGAKTTIIYRKDIDLVEVNVPENSDANPSQSINVNLTKHISFNVDRGGDVSVGNAKKDYTISPEKRSVKTEVTPQVTADKEIQTSLIKTSDKSSSSGEIPRVKLYGQGVPVLINLNNLKKRNRKKKVTTARKRLTMRRRTDAEKENIPIFEKSGEQVSDAESFEYMPGHIYNQNQMNMEPSRSSQAVGNKSSLESSAAATTDSSKGSKQSFTKDLEKSIKLLKTTLNKRYDDAELKKKLIKEVVKKLLKSNYRDDESTTDFLSGLSFSSKKLGLGEGNTTTSTSDANNTVEKLKLGRPKKSILRVETLNSNNIASNSQSAPNLPIISNSDNPVSSNLAKVLTTSNSSSDTSSKDKASTITAFAKTSSEELYQKYLDALRREEAYKRHLRDKEQFLKQKLVASESGCKRNNIKVTEPSICLDENSRVKLKELMKDLTRNNYDDGSGDASKLEGGFSSNMGLRCNEGRSQRSHSVFTLSSSGNSDQNRKSNLKKTEMKGVSKAGHSKDGKHYCCCPHHFGNQVGFIDSSVQVNIESENSPRRSDKIALGPPCPAKSKSGLPVTHLVADDSTGDIKYLCLCQTGSEEVQSPSENFFIYKCSRLSSKNVFCNVPEVPKATDLKSRNDMLKEKPSKSSQTCLKQPDATIKENMCVHEAIRVIQTDISINPRISDPSLSDIKITNSCDCVKLIREQIRQLSKSSIDTDTNVEQSDARVGDGEIFNQPGTSNICHKKETNIRNKNVGQFTAESSIQKSVIQPQGTYGDDGDYTIPIQGTNMTLKVSVGSNPIRNMEVIEAKDFRIRKEELCPIVEYKNSLEPNYSRENNHYEREIMRYDSAVVTETVDTQENATSLTEECSKGVQSTNNTAFLQYQREPRTVNTIFTKEGFNSLGISNPNRPDHKPFLRSKTVDDIEGRNKNTRHKFFEDYYEQDRSVVNTYPKTTVSNFPCPCPQPNECQNLCGENAECRGLLPDYSGTKVDTSCSQVNLQEKEPTSDYSMNGVNDLCPCPEPNECDNLCGENAECRFQMPADPIQNVDTSCGPTIARKPEELEKPDSKRPCPCPVPAKCGNDCNEDEACWKNMRSSSTETPHITETPRKTPCGCPDSSKCGGFCGKDAACRKKSPDRNETVKVPPLSLGQITKKKQVPAPIPAPREKSPCDCPNSAKCGGFCKKDAACRKPASTSKRYKPSTPRNSSPSPRNKSPLRKESPRKQPSPRKSPVSTECYVATPRNKSPCSCPPSAKCGGFCGKNAACRKTKADGDTEIRSEDSQSQESDYDFTNFEKLKTYLRSQTFPKQNPHNKSARSHSLQSDEIIGNRLKALLATANDDSPSDDVSVEEQSIPGPSKVQTSHSNDLIMTVIKDITNRYSKADRGKNLKKKCFKEIISILNYLLDTEDTTDSEMIKGLKNIATENSSDIDGCKPEIPNMKPRTSTSRGTCTDKHEDNSKINDDCVPPLPDCCETKATCDKGVQLSAKKSKPYKCCTESSDVVTSSERPCTSSDSVTCKVLNKIRRECEKYHRKCCKRQLSPKRCQCSSTTSMSCDQCKRVVMCQCRAISANCDQCRRVHHCQCRSHKSCKSFRPRTTCERAKKKCIAYNLFIQTSDSIVSEECQYDKNYRPLKSIIVKVPPRKPSDCKVPFKEMECKIGKQCSPRGGDRDHRSKSLPNDSFSSTDDFIKGTVYSVKDYLERNRPDFIEQSGNRQKCLKMITEARASNRAAQRELLSMQVQVEPAIRELSESDIRELARQLGHHIRQRKEPPKLISEREMKRHSQRIYKKLPEVVQKKEEQKKENIKKTNLLMANIFKKNLQKKVLRGSVNLSNYSAVVKI